MINFHAITLASVPFARAMQLAVDIADSAHTNLYKQLQTLSKCSQFEAVFVFSSAHAAKKHNLWVLVGFSWKCFVIPTTAGVHSHNFSF